MLQRKRKTIKNAKTTVLPGMLSVMRSFSLCEEGYDENMYLDPMTRTKVEETGGANFLFVTKEGKLVTSGGRVLGVTAIAETLPEAIKASYGLVEKIHFDNAFYRHDIGARALAAKEE